MTSAAQTQEWPEAEDSQQEAAEVRLRSVGEAWDGSKVSCALARQEREGLQAVAKPSQAPQAIKRYRTINGIDHKLCNGVFHPEGKWVPVSDFYRRARNGVIRPRPRCKDCERHDRGSEPMVPYTRVKFAVVELVGRVGKAEAARMMDIPKQHVWMMLNGKKKWLHKKTVAKILLALKEARDNNMVRHRDSIKHGAALRGRVEREAINLQDYYQPETGEQRKERLAAEAERKREARAAAKRASV